MDRKQLTDQCSDFLQATFLASEDGARYISTLSKLVQHLKVPVILTGSVATSWHLSKRGVQRQKRRFNDVDVVIQDLSNIRSSLSRDFLIKHFHPDRGQGRILMQLVDEESRTRIDVFTPTTRTLTTRLTDFVVNNISCRFVSTEDLLAKLLSAIYPVISGRPVDPKYIEHFHLLSTITDLCTAREVWREYRTESQPLEFEEAVAAIERSITIRPKLLQVGHYSQDITQTCQWCCESELFPLAESSMIYEILGYV